MSLSKPSELKPSGLKPSGLKPSGTLASNSRQSPSGVSTSSPRGVARTLDYNLLPSHESVYCFSILCDANSGTFSRILELFAKRNLVPHRAHSDVIGRNDEKLTIDMQVAGLTQDLADYIARCMRQIYGVETVLFSQKIKG